MSTQVIRAACPHDCPDTCALLVTVEDGRATRVQGDPDHPTTAGVLCTKVNRYAERTYHPNRLLTPMKRVGAKGEGKFEPISWGEAIDTIATRLGDIAARNPEAILPYSYAGTMGLVQGKAWPRASSTSSERRCSIARSAHRPGQRRCATRMARASAWTSSTCRTPS